MDNNSTNPSLLGFLQKKSLFSNSPNNARGRNRSRSSSRDKSFQGNRSNVYQLQDKHEVASGSKFNYQEDNLRNYDRNAQRIPNDETGSMFSKYQNNDNRIRFQPNLVDPKPYHSTLPTRANDYSPQIQLNNDYRTDQRQYQSNMPRSDTRPQQRNFQLPTSPTGDFNRNNHYQEEKYFKTSEVVSNPYEDRRSNASRPLEGSPYQNQIWSALVANTHTFQSSRLESIQCLESLSGRMVSEISNINFKIDNFNSILSKTLSQEFRGMREKVLQMVEAIFKDSDRFIKDYMKQQENRMAGQIIKMREVLMKQQAKIEVMKQELKKPSWRKTAGQILTTELQKRVQEMIRSTSQMQVGHWQLGDLGGSNIQKVQSQLRQLVRLKPIK